jgi:hypothetical protein
MIKMRGHKKRLGDTKTKKGFLKNSLKYFLGDGLLRNKDQSLYPNQLINIKHMLKSFD